MNALESHARGSTLAQRGRYGEAIEQFEAALSAAPDHPALDPARLYFAPHLPYAAHLGRLPAADLCLDTFPMNGGATASDALWMALPVLTCSGRAFSSRMAGSLLTALDLPELVTSSLEEYEHRARELLAHPEQLTALRGRLQEARRSRPLFDTARFARRFETALVEVHQRKAPH